VAFTSPAPSLLAHRVDWWHQGRSNVSCPDGSSASPETARADLNQVAARERVTSAVSCRRTRMRKLLAFVGGTIGGYIGWYLGALVGFMTGFIVSTIGSGVGMYMAYRAAQNYE
jgi:hypothetical protein